MNEIKCNIAGVEFKELKKHSDQRGWLSEIFRQDEIDNGKFPVMSYISMTKPGVTRGPHEHKDQTDYICFVGQSSFKIYLWDNRPDSPTTGKFFEFVAVEGGPVSVKIPPGVVHAYKNIGLAEGIIINSPDKLYAGHGKNEPVDEIRYENQPDSRFKLDD